jgi:hypothetical protein
MLNRRELVTLFVTSLVPGIASVACGGKVEDQGTSTSTSPTNPTAACDGLAATSTNVQDHVHNVCVPLADLANPPAAGATYTTTTANGHVHTLQLTQAQLQQLSQGVVVSMTTSVAEDHVHIFTMQRAVTETTIAPPV